MAEGTRLLSGRGAKLRRGFESRPLRKSSIMRIGALLLVGLCLLSAPACTTASPPDEDCIAAGGVCFTSQDQAGCNTPIPNAACGAGYTCCTKAYAGNMVDGAVTDAPSGNPGTPDAGTDADAGSTATKDAATTKDTGSTATKDAATSKDSAISPPAKDGAASKDSGSTVAKDGSTSG